MKIKSKDPINIQKTASVSSSSGGKKLTLAVSASLVAMLSGCLAPTGQDVPVKADVDSSVNQSDTSVNPSVHQPVDALNVSPERGASASSSVPSSASEPSSSSLEALGRLSIDVNEEEAKSKSKLNSTSPAKGSQSLDTEEMHKVPGGTEAVTLMRALGEKDVDATDTVKSLVTQSAVHQINQKTSAALTAMTKGGHAEVSMDSSFDHGMTGSVRLWTPVYQNERMTLYTQEGVMRRGGESSGQLSPESKARILGHFGVGVRYFPWAYDKRWGNWMFGANFFIDEDFTRHHRRASVGAEIGSDQWLIAGNIYRRLTSWRSSDDFLSAMVEERPANGWDLRAKWWVPYKTNLALTGKVSKWEGERVSTFGSRDQFGKNPTVYGVGLEYRPVPALVVTAQREWDKHEKNTEVGVKVNIPLSPDWADAFEKTDNKKPSRLNNARESFVERDYSMPLEYRNKPGVYHITPCPSTVRNGQCLRVTDGYDEPVAGLTVTIKPQSACVALDQKGKYRTGQYGEVHYNVVSACTRFTTVDVEAGKTHVTLPINISKLTWTLQGHPEVLRFGETSIIELSSGEVAMAGLPIQWTVQGGHLSHFDRKTNAKGIARATFIANELAGEVRSAIVIATVADEPMRLPIMVTPIETQAALTIKPQRITKQEMGVASVEGLLPYERVTWLLSSGTDVRLHKSKTATNGVKAMTTMADKRGFAAVFLKVREGNSGEANVHLDVVPERSPALREAFTVVHQDAGIDGAVGQGLLTLSVDKTSLPKDALSGNQTMKVTLRGGKLDGVIHWAGVNGAVSAQESTFDKCTGRGCVSSVELSGVEPYEGEATIEAEHNGVKKQFTIEYRNYDQAALGLVGKPAAIEFDKTFEVEIVGVLPGSIVHWGNGLSAKATAATSEADAEGRAIMTYTGPVDYNLWTEHISAEYHRNTVQTKQVELDISLLNWTDKLLLTVSKPLLLKSEDAVFTLSGGKPGMPVSWSLAGPGTIVSQEGQFDDMGNARLTLHSDTAAPGVKSTVTASVRKTSLAKDVQFVEFKKDFCERCFFGSEAIGPVSAIIERTTATATAAFPATCLAPQGVWEKFTCDEVYKQTSFSTCEPGTTKYLTIQGGDSLVYDLCPLGDQMKVSYKCGYAHYLNFELNGYPAITLRVGNVGGPLTNAHDDRCHATIRYIREECSGETCVGTIDARVLLTTHLQGAISGKITYPNDNEDTMGHWEDQCGDYR